MDFAGTFSTARRPVRRSKVRLWLGKQYLTLRRYIVWLFGGIQFAHVSDAAPHHTVFRHATPLLRQLRKQDMGLQLGKIVNLRLAAASIDGVTLFPGETFSYWRTIGPPTRRRGYRDGMILRSGTIAAGVGGGMCQMSNLIYWMTLHTPLTVVERHRHGYDVFPDSNRTQPFGSGATCFYNYGDLMVRNDTDDIWQLRVSLTDTELVGRWLCDRPADCRYEVYEESGFIQAEPWGMYTRHNILRRRKLDPDGNVTDDEYVTENHAFMMYAPLLEG
jgi:vancomycin resistance protein VanW